MKFICAALFFATGFITSSSHAALAGEIFKTGVYGIPAMAAKLTINPSTDKFEQEVKVIYDENVKLKDIRSWVTTGEVISKVSGFVGKAIFSRDPVKTPADANSYQFALTIGKFGFFYSHNYTCHENLTDSSWEQVCEQLPVAQGTDVAMTQSTKTTVCQVVQDADSKKNSTQCRMSYTGIMHKVLGFESMTVSYKFFKEVTSYLAYLNLIIPNVENATDEVKARMNDRDWNEYLSNIVKNVKAGYEKSEYKKLMDEIENIKPEKVRANAESAAKIIVEKATPKYLQLSAAAKKANQS